MESPPPLVSRWTRRAFLTSLLAPLGYASYRFAAHNQWIIRTHGRRAFDLGVEPNPSRTKQQLSLLIVGDTGKDTLRRTNVVDAMRRHAKRWNPNAAMLLGDNFYERGVESVDDPRFRSDFESLFDSESFDMPFYVCLGNHDVLGNAEAQVQYTQRSRRWELPARYYQSRLTAGDADVDFFVLDTSTLLHDGDESDEQEAWLRETLSNSDADYRIVVGHHPVLTGGQHEVDGRIRRVLAPIFQEFAIDLYLSGHDHDLQLLESDAGWLQAVSGSGSKLRSTRWIDETIFAEADAGFCWLLIDEGQISLSYYNAIERLFTLVVPRATTRVSAT